MIQVVWEFVVKPDARQRFEQAYGAQGPWVRLFERHAGYRGTALWRDRDNPLRYLTIDAWETADQRAAMLEASHEEYARLDRELDRLTESERELGLFEPGAHRGPAAALPGHDPEGADGPRATAADVARRLLAAWDARDLDDLMGLLADDVEWYDPAMPEPPARGRAAVRAFSESVLQAFPDFRYEIQAPICSAADGSRCAILWRITGTHLHPLRPLGYAPTGRRVSLEGVDVLDVRDGLVTRILTAFDPLSGAEQLLDRPLRPVPGTWRARCAVAAQRCLAYLARR